MRRYAGRDRQCRSEHRTARGARAASGARTAACALALAFTLAAAPGCHTVQILALGRLPPEELLESSLVVGESTPEDVRRVLGPPAGIGRSQSPLEEEPRTLWAYQASRGASGLLEARESRRGFLFVYFREGHYDGYLRFSSLP